MRIELNYLSLGYIGHRLIKLDQSGKYCFVAVRRKTRLPHLYIKALFEVCMF